MLMGKCPRCGTEYYGWALRTAAHQNCDGCGVALKIIHDVHKTTKGSTPIEVEEFTEPAPQVTPVLEKEICLQKT